MANAPCVFTFAFQLGIWQNGWLERVLDPLSGMSFHHHLELPPACMTPRAARTGSFTFVIH
jgi:hypothetical protein